VHGRSPAWVGLRRAGLVRSLLPAGLLALGYVVLLIIGAMVGITVPHFDHARRVLGLVPVLALYLPLWGVLEGVWVNHLVRTTAALLGQERPGWRSIALAALWFGVVHVIVQVVLEGGGLGSLLSVLTGVFALVAGVLLRRTGNGWGFVLFWTVVNF
jgi:hypothetical protein